MLFKLKMKTYPWCVLSLLMLTNSSGQTSTDPQFQALSLGDSNFLLKWKSPVEKAGTALQYDITVNEITSDGKIPSIRKVVAGEADHYSTRLTGFKPDTNYRINIEATGRNIEKPLTYTLEARTNKDIRSPPAKPDFDFEIISDRKAYPKVKITWLPCGKENKCGDAIPGAYFYVKYELKDSDRFIVKQEVDEDFVYLSRCSPSKSYRVRVVSVNKYNETESDPKEIVLPTIPNLEIMEVLNGADVTVPCKKAASSKGPFKWTVNTLRKDSPRLIPLPNGNLKITKVERFDRGQYKCSVVNETNTEEFVTYLDVKDRTVILNSGSQKTFERKVGKSFRKDCSPLHDNSLGVAVNWFKDGQKINFEPNGHFKRGEYNSLHIPLISKEETGNYSCVATTRLDSDTYAFRLNVV